MGATMTHDEMYQRAFTLGLYGLCARWDEVGAAPWVQVLLDGEEAERKRRSLERRLKNARIDRFKPMADFDWNWPKKAPRDAIDDLFTFRFIGEGANAVLLGPNGVGKSMIAQNLAHQALLRGFTARYTTASAMLSELVAQDGSLALQRRLGRYCRPQLLVIDEVGYLSYDNRHADLLFEVVTRRYRERSIVVTTNKPFAEWNEVFPNAACVVTLVDRLVHDAEIIALEGESYRLKEAKENAARRSAARKSPKS
jgi:DNA replication protein DnaC